MNRKKSFYFFRISNNSKLDLIGGIALLIKQKLISLLKFEFFFQQMDASSPRLI